MLASLLGYFFCMVTALTAFTVSLTGFVNISQSRQVGHHPRPPAISVMVETQRHSRVAKETAPALDVSPVVAAAGADVKKSKHYKSKLVARQRNNYGYRTALGYAAESGYAQRGPFFQ
jgi:hypothetical protein